MTRELRRRAASTAPTEPLSSSYWTQLTHVRVPGSDERIDLVLVGPSGVHVVTDRPGQPTADGHGTPDLDAAARLAADAAVAVAGLLPERYRNVVSSAVCLPGATEVGVSVGLVLAASPDVLRHTWRHQPRLLSTSEAAALARLLQARLLPCPVPVPPRTGRWWRRAPRDWTFRRARSPRMLVSHHSAT